MKSTLNRKKAPSDYPILKCAKVNSDLVVLFIAPRIGVVLAHGTSLHNVGTYDDTWDELNYVPYHGFITLEN